LPAIETYAAPVLLYPLRSAPGLPVSRVYLWDGSLSLLRFILSIANAIFIIYQVIFLQIKTRRGGFL
jgi:hypothetical protein